MIIITRVGTALQDKNMNLYNKKKKKKIIVSPDYWEGRDADFDEIKSNYYVIKNKVNSNEDGHHIIDEHTPISDQLSLGSCVANTWCDLLEILMGLENPNTVVQMSRLFLYWCARDLTGIQNEDLGTYNRAAAHQLRKVGVVAEKWFPYDTSKVFTPPELDLYTMASRNRIESFYRIFSTGDEKVRDIELAVRANHPVAIATVVNKDFMKYRGGGQVFSMPSEWEGRHAMIVVGVRLVNGSRQFLLRNSWGKYWGDEGHAWVDEGYIRNPETQDVWVGTRMTFQ
jgi:C1A family cysteine protease